VSVDLGNPGIGSDFPPLHSLQTVGPAHIIMQWTPGGHAAGHALLPIAQVKNAWSFTYTHIRPNDLVLKLSTGRTFLLLLFLCYNAGTK
jgi:hypothetical protein